MLQCRLRRFCVDPSLTQIISVSNCLNYEWLSITLTQAFISFHKHINKYVLCVFRPLDLIQIWLWKFEPFWVKINTNKWIFASETSTKQIVMRDSTANEIAQLITLFFYLHCTSLINLDGYLSSDRTNSNV